MEGFQKGVSSVSGLSQPYIERKRTASEDMVGLIGDRNVLTYFQTLEGLKPGKYELGACHCHATGKSGEAARNYVKDVYLYADG